MSTSVFLTKEGYKKLEEELGYLKSVKRSEISEKIKVAREFGDLSENSEYEAARNEQSIMEERIQYIEEHMKHATVLDESAISTDIVSIGTEVKLFDHELEEEVFYTIVGKTESDPINNKISNQSPIGKALIGHKVGTSVTVDAPGGSFICDILEIRIPDQK